MESIKKFLIRTFNDRIIFLIARGFICKDTFIPVSREEFQFLEEKIAMTVSKPFHIIYFGRDALNDTSKISMWRSEEHDKNLLAIEEITVKWVKNMIKSCLIRDNKTPNGIM